MTVKVYTSVHVQFIILIIQLHFINNQCIKRENSILFDSSDQRSIRYPSMLEGEVSWNKKFFL